MSSSTADRLSLDDSLPNIAGKNSLQVYKQAVLEIDFSCKIDPQDTCEYEFCAVLLTS